MSQEITVDFSEKVVETQTKIDRLQGMIYDIENQKKVLDDFKKSHIPRDTKFKLSLAGVLKCSVKISVEMLIPLLEQNIEDNTVIIHELAKELRINEK